MVYQVKTEKFEGPLELLVELIEKEKLSVTELSLAHVADQYLEFIRGNESINLEHLSDFLSVASKLLLIKSRALLPTLELTEEEDAEIKDLTEQLALYKKFKEASAKIGNMSARRQISYSRDPFWGIKSVFYPPENINIFDLKKCFLSILAEIPIVEKLEKEFLAEVMTLEEKISELQNVLRQRIETNFAELTAGAADKIEIIISFLAVLEMIKQRVVEAEQTELFSEIKLRQKYAIAEI
ncbi:MAG: segregation/condensation protein A [Candidatus Moranbacteria bacterium]|nr:segregation/condensation protein A [Candidatus Moranbacteria bacterium]